MIKNFFIILALILIILGVVMMIKQPKVQLIDIYKSEHIADFVAFAKKQLHLPKVKAIKAIRQEFRHLSLMEAVEVYELANKENNNQPL